MLTQELASLATRLYPICRSLTGPGVRQTLAILSEIVPLEIQTVESGTKVLDWEVPDEWTPISATLRSCTGETLIDFSENNLHLLQYSQPFKGKISREELEKHLHSLPRQPELIPYKTSYYKKDWGFCLSETTRQSLTDPDYQVDIRTVLQLGALNYGEFFIPGESEEEILISTHICHPSLANDNISGILVALACAEYFKEIRSYYSIRFVFVPGTIGAITWLARNPVACQKIRHGLVLTGLGAGDSFTYKQSRAGNSTIDQLVGNILTTSGQPYQIHLFTPYGYDERQYNSPGFALPVGCLMRTPHGSYPEYHTSADNLDFLKIEAVEESIRMVQKILTRLSQNRTYLNQFPYGEPQLGRRGLYAESPEENLALLWLLNLSDGQHSILQICQRSGIDFDILHASAARLWAAGVVTCLTV